MLEPFQVGDKVRMAFPPGRMLIVPQLVPGRLYCVAEVGMYPCTLNDGKHERVLLVGVRRDKRARSTTFGDTLPSVRFALVSRTSPGQQREEKA